MRESKMKVAIMTWYTYRNFGTALQASALFQVVTNLGYSPSLIQYIPKAGMEEKKRITLLWLLKKCLKKISNHWNGHVVPIEREHLFQDFLAERIDETSLCRCYPELHMLNDEFDAFICGSDQIWSPFCYDDKYFLSFVNNVEKMIAYAPSIGTCEIKNKTIRDEIACHLSRFRHLSVREEQGARLVEQLTGKQSEVVLDPTLLISAQEWDSYTHSDSLPAIPREKYIICYFLGNEKRYLRYVQRLSQKMGIPYYIIPVSKQQFKKADAVPFDVGPREFVNLIRNAQYVCTDSFHGMAFAINYNIPFCVFERFSNNDPQNQNSRIWSLLERLHLKDRLVDPSKNQMPPSLFFCDFAEGNRLLAGHRAHSLEYLRNSLSQAFSSNNANNGEYKITDMCCGCGACTVVCSTEAVTISRNNEGFQHYFIDQAKCIRCGQCKGVCPMEKVIAPDLNKSIALYSVKSTSDQVLKVSSSGGVGHELAQLSHRHGGYACGCMYDSSLNIAKHIVVSPDEPEKLPLLQGSKYIQSVSAEALRQVAKIAETNQVFFFGTPCQVAAVDKILLKKGLRNNALLIDLICHGIPSQHLWEKYLHAVDQRYRTGKHPSVIFRSKEREWRQLLMRISGDGHTYKKEERQDDFYAFFHGGLCSLTACSDCPYRERSAADLRIGDYWGEKFKKDRQGVSMVIANTSAGLKALLLLQDSKRCVVQEQNIEDYWHVQYPYNPQRPLIRERLLEELKDGDNDLHRLRKEYCAYHDQIERIKQIKSVIRRLIKRG